MADDKTLLPPNTTYPQPVPPTPAVPLDETVPGGAYKVGGRWVNAYGVELTAPSRVKITAPSGAK